MGRNLYILAGTLGVLSIVSVIVSFTDIAGAPGSPGDAMLWRTTGVGLLCVSLIVALGGILSSLFEQADRRAEQDRQIRRDRRRS